MDIEAIKAKLEAIKKNKSTNGMSGSDGKIKWWKPTDDQSVIRFIQKPGSDDIIREYNWHYNLQDRKAFVCNKRSFPDKYQTCPACEVASKLWSDFEESGRTNDAFGNLAKKLFATKRFYAPIVARGKEEMGVQIYGFGKEMTMDVYNAIIDPENEGKFTDSEDGFDFKVTLSERPGSNFKMSKGSTMKKPSKVINKEFLAKNPDVTLESLYEQIPDMETLFEASKDSELTEAVGALVGALEEQLHSEEHELGEEVALGPVEAALAKLGK